MTTCSKEIPATATPASVTSGKALDAGLRGGGGGWQSTIERVRPAQEAFSLVATMATTLTVFGIFLIQGIIVARILGPAGRGEFGTVLYFPREVLLYAGLLGTVEVIARYAARNSGNENLLKYSAARLGLITGTLTGVAAALLTIALLVPTNKAYLIPFALVCCLFLPWEHMHLTVSAVDRGRGSWRRYNVNRLAFAVAFPLLVVAARLIRLPELLNVQWLWVMCGLFVLARVVGLLPTLRGMHVFSPRQRRELIEQAGEENPTPRPRKLLRHGRPYAVSMLVSELFDRLDIFLILAVATVTASGYYFVAIPAAALLMIAPHAVSMFTFNAGAAHGSPVTRSKAMQVMGLVAAMQVVSTILLSLVIDQLIVFFYSDAFAAAIPFALWLLPAAAMRGFTQATDAFLKGRGKPMIGVSARLIGIPVMLCFALFAWSSYGLLSIPMAACAGQAVASMIVVIGVLWNADPDQPASLAGGEAS